MSSVALPNDLDACHQLITELLSQREKQSAELSLKDKLIKEQAHSVLELQSDRDKLGRKVTDLTLALEKLRNQLYGRRSERRVSSPAQLWLDLGDEATPEVISALDEAIREAQETVDEAAEARKKRRKKRPKPSDRKFPEHLPRVRRASERTSGAITLRAFRWWRSTSRSAVIGMARMKC